MNDIVSKFTNHLKNALTRALCLVVESKGQTITPIHLLWALSTQQGCVASEILLKSKIDMESLRTHAGDDGTVPSKPVSHEQNFMPALSEEAKNVIEKAVLTANVYEHRYVGTEHLLSGLLQTSPSEVQRFFKETNADIRNIQINLANVFKTTATFPDLPDQKTVTDALQELENFQIDETNEEDESKTPAIDYFTDEMTDEEVVEDFTPVVGRELEILRLTKILSRRQKNNPILVGKPGVGKTAIVEGVAKKIVDGDVPESLLDKKILRLDLASMIAGTMYRGEFESRLRQLIDEVSDRPEIVLFIDEVHTIMGAGAASGSLDAANILKPALARGDIHCIGATTPEEFKKHIETDGALERRFQPIPVKEPSKQQTQQILDGIKSYYEDHHAVRYTKDAVIAACELAERYFPSKSFPDKAIDILDEAGALAGLSRKAKKAPSIKSMKAELEEVREQKKQAVIEEKFREAIELKTKEESLELKIDEKNTKPPARKQIAVDQTLVLQTVADMIDIPVSQLTGSEQKRLAKLPETLSGIVIGQPSVTNRVAQSVQKAKLGLSRKDKPLASFLFLGPSGVGKTLLAKTLANELFQTEENFLRLDMSEYAEPYTISKLIGSPAGYVGYRESTKLTDHVKQHPHSLILFDELEKAHPDVHNLLLQILDDGMLTDATGRKINFRNCIIVLTTNAGQETFRGQLGFGDSTNKTQDEQFTDVRDKLEERFKPELLNRVGTVCVFQNLNTRSMENIVKKELTEMKHRLKEQDIDISFGSTLAKFIASQVREKQGARDISRLIEELVEHKIARLLLKNPRPGKAMKISLKKNQIQVSEK